MSAEGGYSVRDSIKDNYFDGTANPGLSINNQQ